MSPLGRDAQIDTTKLSAVLPLQNSPFDASQERTLCIFQLETTAQL